MWDRIGRIVSGQSKSFELDENGTHMVHKKRQDDKDSPRWPIPEEWTIANTSFDDVDGNRVTSLVIPTIDDSDLYAVGPARCVGMPASTRPRILT